jgi:hypothetical protein
MRDLAATPVPGEPLAGAESRRSEASERGPEAPLEQLVCPLCTLGPRFWALAALRCFARMRPLAEFFYKKEPTPGLEPGTPSLREKGKPISLVQQA